MIEKLIRRLEDELSDIRNRINWAESSQNGTDFISARLAVNDAENTLRNLKKEIRNENTG